MDIKRYVKIVLSFVFLFDAAIGHLEKEKRKEIDVDCNSFLFVFFFVCVFFSFFLPSLPAIIWLLSKTIDKSPSSARVDDTPAVTSTGTLWDDSSSLLIFHVEICAIR